MTLLLRCLLGSALKTITIAVDPTSTLSETAANIDIFSIDRTPLYLQIYTSYFSERGKQMPAEQKKNPSSIKTQLH